MYYVISGKLVKQTNKKILECVRCLTLIGVMMNIKLVMKTFIAAEQNQIFTVYKFWYLILIQYYLNLKVWESYDGVFCNYFSLGVDAVAASAFHEHREAHPELFKGRLSNQVNPFFYWTCPKSNLQYQLIS